MEFPLVYMNHETIVPSIISRLSKPTIEIRERFGRAAVPLVCDCLKLDSGQ